MKYFLIYFIVGTFFNLIYTQRRAMIVNILDWFLFGLIWSIAVPFFLLEDFRRKNG